MAAPVASIEALNGFDSLHCPACGHIIFGEDQTDDGFCPHLVFFVDWVGELSFGHGGEEGASTEEQERLLTAWEGAEDADQAVRAMADALPSHAVVLELVEPARGGGHDGSYCAAAFLLGQEDS